MKLQEQMKKGSRSRLSRLFILIPVLLLVLVSGGCGGGGGDGGGESGIAVTGVKIEPKITSVIVGETRQLTVSISPNNATNRKAIWNSNNTSVATVNASGLVTGISVGTAKITVTTEDGIHKDSCEVTVVAAPVLVSGVTVAPKAATITVGGNKALTATVTPENAMNKNITWSSSNQAVATVSATGAVTGVSAGTAMITVKTEDGEFTDTCEITVTVAVTGVTVAPKTASIIVGGTQSLAAAVTPANATNKNITWSSSNQTVATVSATGAVTGVSAGTVMITVKTEDGEFTDTCEITVTVAVTGVTVAPKTASIIIGGTQPLAATVTPANATNKNITWSSSNQAVATVSATGAVTGISAGTATITVKTEDGEFTDTCAITVTIPVTGVSVAPKAATIIAGTTQTLAATITPENATNKNVAWSSSNQAVATVNASGVVTGVSGGTTTITVKTEDGGFTDTCEITVTVPVTGVNMTAAAASILTGGTRQLTADIVPANATNKNITWKSNNQAVVTVNATGLITGISVGTATITVTTEEGGFTDTCEVTVVVTTVPVSGVTVAPKAASIIVGASQQLRESITPLNATNFNVTWSSSNEAVATVNAAGIVTGVSAGTATITVRTEDGGFTDTCDVTVTVPVTGVTMVPRIASMDINSTMQLTATVEPANATNKNVSWSSSNRSVATVNDSGMVTVFDAGTVRITVTTEDGGFTDTCEITVVVPVTGVTIEPRTASIIAGASQQLRETISPANATNLNVTWSSNNEAVATVNATGIVTGVSAGTATITVKTVDGEFTDTCVVTVTVPVTGVTMVPRTASIDINSTRQLTATVEPANATNKNVTWSSNNEAVAAVNSSGIVTGVSVGNAVITVKTVDGDFTDTCSVSVALPVIRVTGVTVEPKTASIAVDGTRQLSVTVFPGNATNKNVTWSSSNRSVATVSATGVVTGVSDGTATITARTDDGVFTDTCVVSIYKQLAPIMEVEISSFRLAPWNQQEWQALGKHPNGEIHPLLPLKFEAVLSANRPNLTIDDQVWIAIYLMEDTTKASMMSRPFSSPENEPVDDPLYLGFFAFDLEEGRQTIDFEMHPEIKIPPGNYKGLRAEFFAPGLDAEIIGKTHYEWLHNLIVLDLNNLPVIDIAWSELTQQADVSILPNTPGFDFVNENTIVDPKSGFTRLFDNDTPLLRGDQSDNPVINGYYTELSVKIDILALCGTVKTLEITEDNGLSFWNPDTGRFERTYRWEGRHIAVQHNPVLDIFEVVSKDGFPRGTNGTTIIVGYMGKTPPSIKVEEISLSINARTGESNMRTSYIRSLSDETMRPANMMQSVFRPQATGNDFPFYLKEDPKRVNLPVTLANLKMDFSNNMFIWDEEEPNSGRWEVTNGPKANSHYIGSGKRNLFKSDLGDKNKFAALAYLMYEEYAGLVHRLPREGEYAIHDITSICGTRTEAGVSVFVFGAEFSLLKAGAEFRSDLYGKTASERNAAGTFSLITDRREIDAYNKFSGMESEFNAEVSTLGITLIALPLYCNNTQPYNSALADKITLFTKSFEVFVTGQIFMLNVRAGAIFTFYIELKLSNKFDNIENGLKGTGSVALMPGIKAEAFAEAGIELIIASAHLGIKLLLIDLTFVPEYVMEGEVKWRNGTKEPEVTSNWKSYPKLSLIIRTLDGSIYVRARFLIFKTTKTFFSWTGIEIDQTIWQGKPSDRRQLTLPLGRSNN